MGNNMGHASKLEPPADDTSESRLRDAMDLLIADFADRQVFDEQARLVQETETLDSDTLRATSRIKIHPFDKTSWTKRVLSRFRRG